MYYAVEPLHLVGGEVFGLVEAELPVSRVSPALRRLMRRLALFSVIVAGLALAGSVLLARSIGGPIRSLTLAAERIGGGDLTTPVARTLLSYKVGEIHLTRMPSWTVLVRVYDNTGGILVDEHGGTDARDLIVALNKADLTVKSLERRILEHLIAEGKIPAATITGSASGSLPRPRSSCRSSRTLALR